MSYNASDGDNKGIKVINLNIGGFIIKKMTVLPLSFIRL